MTNSEKSDSRPPTARGAATRARIVDAAAARMHAHGVNGTSLDDVIADSGVSKSQLYHYFVDKDALVLEVVACQTERVLNAQRPYLGALDSLSALRSWRNAIIRLNERATIKGCPLGSLASELANDSEEVRERIAQSFEMWRVSIEAGLVSMRDRGDLGPGADPHELSTALLVATQGGLLMAKTMHSARPLKIALDMAIEHIAKHAKAA